MTTQAKTSRREVTAEKAGKNMDLSALAEQINCEHQQAADHARSAIGHALECGQVADPGQGEGQTR